MALRCGRFTNKHILSTLRGIPSVFSQAHYADNTILIKYKKYEPPKEEDHDYKNMRLKRPMSPHLTIYAPQLTSFTSITHRVTGFILSVFAVALGVGSLYLKDGVETYVCMLKSLHIPKSLAFLIKMLVGLPFAYHACNGIRHFVFDAGFCLNLPQAYKTAHLVFVFTFIISIYFASK